MAPRKRLRRDMRIAEEDLYHPLDSLPNELLIEIFSYLNLSEVYAKISLVCKRFNKVCNVSGGVCSGITLGDRQVTEGLSQSLKLIEHCSALRRITFSRYHSTLPVRALHSCKNLVSLTITTDLSFTEIEDGHLLLQAIGEVGRSLRKISLLQAFAPGVFKANASCLSSITHFELLSLRDEDVMAIANHCHRIQRLCFVHCGEVTTEGWNYILERARGTLRYLGIPGNTLDNKSFEWMRQSRLLEAMSINYMRLPRKTMKELLTLTGLRSLTFLYCKVVEGSLGRLYKDGALQGVKELSFEGVKGFRDRDLEVQVTTLRLIKCHDLKPFRGLRSILAQCTKMTTLVLCHFSVQFLDPDWFRQVAAPLRVLEIVGWVTVNDSRKIDLIASLAPWLIVRKTPRFGEIDCCK